MHANNIQQTNKQQGSRFRIGNELALPAVSPPAVLLRADYALAEVLARPDEALHVGAGAVGSGT